MEIPVLLAIVAGLWLLLVLAGGLEALKHRLLVNRIPVRVHVNGTRGKTSVTRLIAAGLRAGGKRVCAKTTVPVVERAQNGSLQCWCYHQCPR